MDELTKIQETVIPIVTDKNKLRQVSEQATPEDDIEGIVEQIKKSTETAWTPGCGLAAIQIGIPKQISWFEYNGVSCTLINPKIIQHSGIQVKPEGCLSIPDKYPMVKRFVNINILNHKLIIKDGIRSFEAYEVPFFGFEARVIQHEMDHMQGKLIIDKKDKTNDPTKISRNAICPLCDSGKKYKKCCLV